MISILIDRIVAGVVAETIDLTRKLDDQTKFTIRNELERDTFELVVPDMDIHLSDLDGSLYNKFFTAPISTVWKICIKNNGKVKFRGFLNTDFIKRDQNQEYVSLTSFSTMWKFWDIANTIKAGQAQGAANYYTKPDGNINPGYFSFQDLFKWSYLSFFSQNNILQNIDIDPSILIRSNTMLVPNTRTPYVPVYTMPSILVPDMPIILTNPIADWTGNDVLLKYLMGTLKDLLIAVAIRNNSEWYIDPETESLKLRQRNSIVNDLAEDLSERVVDSDTVEVAFSDQKRYDYVSITPPMSDKNIPKLNAVILTPFAQDPIKLGLGGRPMGQYRYVLSSLDEKSNEISCGQFLTVITPLESGSHIEGKGDNSLVYRLALISLNIPALTGIGTVAKRRLYRTCDWIIGGGLDQKSYNGNFFLVKEFQGNVAIDFVDDESDHDFIERAFAASAEENKTFVLDLNKTLSSLNVWIRYDEDLGTWNEPIYDDGTNQPIGTIFAIKADLQFSDATGSGTHAATNEELFYFFGGDVDYQTIQFRWKDLMITKRKATLSMKGNDLNIGDAFTLNKITKLKGIGKLVVKTDTEDMIQEECNVELISV